MFRDRYTGTKLSETVNIRKAVHEFENNVREVDTHTLANAFLLGKLHGKPNYYEKSILCIYNEKQSCQEMRTFTTFGQLILFLERQSPGIEL